MVMAALDIEVGTRGRGVRCEKLRAPRFPGSHVSRARLVRRMVDSDAELVTISAPAGAGNTTLLTSWSATPEVAGSIAWLSLDHHDTTAVRIWEALLAALRGLPSLPDDHPVRGFQAPVGEVDQRFTEQVMTSLASLDGPCWLVLDDVHRVRAPAARAVLDDLMERLPGQLRLVVASRVALPSLPHQAGSPQTLLELRASDLAFTAAEVDELLRVHGLELDQRARTSLLVRTEGWAAGLRLAVAGLATADHPQAFLARFDGDTRSVSDYLASELLHQLPASLLDLLLSTSICGGPEAPLVVELSGRPDAGPVLDTLVRDHALVAREEGATPRYRYHELLRTFLEAELRRRDLRRWQHLHGVAARWYREAGLPERALGHAVTAEDRELVEALLGRQGVAALLDGEPDRLAEVLDRLPPRWRTDALPLSLRAALALAGNDAATAGLLLAEARAATEPRAPWLRTFLAVLELQHARLVGERDRLLAAIDALDIAADRAPNPAVRLASRLTRAFAALEDGAPARPVLQEVPLLWEGADPGQLSTRLLLATWGPVEVRQALRIGEVDLAEAAAERVRRWLPETAEAALVTAALARSAGRAADAQVALAPVLSGHRPTLVAASGVTARVVAAELAVATGDRVRATELLDNALAIAAPARWWRPFAEAEDATRCLVVDLVERHLGDLPGRAEPRAALGRTQPVHAVLAPPHTSGTRPVPGAAVAADGVGDRRGAPPVGQHHQDPPEIDVPQAGRPRPTRCRRGGPGARAPVTCGEPRPRTSVAHGREA